MIGMVFIEVCMLHEFRQNEVYEKHLNHTVEVLCMLFFVISRLQYQ